MKTLAFLDCPTGISGDMCLGALVDAGFPLKDLQAGIAQLALPEPVTLRAETVHRNGIAATKVHVDLAAPEVAHAHPPERHLGEILALIQAAPLPERAIAWSCHVFEQLAIAEGAVHGIDPAQVHFHEVGATDAIVDIVGTCLGLDGLNIDALYCSALPTGAGTVRAAHGRLPVPAPAVLRLLTLAQVPVYSNGLQGELVTPTGAAIATTLCQGFGPPPPMALQQVGLGAGNKSFALPNMLRLWIGTSTDASPPYPASHPSPPPSTHAPGSSHGHGPGHRHGPGQGSEPGQGHVPEPGHRQHLQQGHPPHSHEPDDLPLLPHTPAPTPPHAPEAPGGMETVMVLETQVDDLTPQAIGYLGDRLRAAGALDVFVQAVTMKKSRPGHLITVVLYPTQLDPCEAVLFQETTTLGIRRQTQQRHRLTRSRQPVSTPWGRVHIKVAHHPVTGALLNAHPEYDDCAAIAQAQNLPWQTVHQQAIVAWRQQHPPSGMTDV